MISFQHPEKSEIKYIVLLTTLILIIAGILYKDFLIGEKLYIYADQGCDTLNSYWPSYSYFINAIKSHELSFWIFQEGLGNSIFSNAELLIDPFNVLLLFFNKLTLPYAFGYIAVLKILLAGLFFYLYISCFNITPYARLAGALLYAFNGYMILWGQHYQFATMLVFVPLLLYAYEKLITSSRVAIKILFSGIIVYIAIFSLYFFYMISIYLLLYSTVRWLISSKNNFFVFAINPFLYYVLGIGIGSVFIFPCLHLYLNNPRIVIDNAGQTLFNFDAYKNYIFLFLRFFSNKFYFVMYLQNYDPALYSGIPALILMPQLFYFLNKRQKLIFLTSVSILIFSLIFPFFSYLMNAFTGPSFRWSFIIPTTFTIIFCFTLDYVRRNNRINIHNLSVTIYSLIMILLITFLLLKILIFNFYVILLLIFYLLIFIKFNLNSIYFKTGLLILISIEIIAASYGVVNDRDIVKQKSLEDKKGYFDYTNEAVAYLQQQDKSFYRVDKNYLSVFFKDPLMQNYNGVTAYNSLNNPGTIEFLKALNVPFLIGAVNNISGLDSRQILQALVGVKYFLTKSGAAIPFGYKYVTAFGDVRIFKNEYSLPLGFTFDTYMTMHDFNKLQIHQKDEVLLKAFVTDSDSEPLNNYTRISEKDLKNYLAPIQVSILSQKKDIILNNEPLELFNKHRCIEMVQGNASL
jgi:hypothetical protein